MEEYGRDWCIHSYTMMAGVLANFGPNSQTIQPIWRTFPTRCSTDGFFNFSVCCSNGRKESLRDHSEQLWVWQQLLQHKYGPIKSQIPAPLENFSILSLLRVVLKHSETVSGPSSCGVTDRFLANKRKLLISQMKMYHCTYVTVWVFIVCVWGMHIHCAS